MEFWGISIEYLVIVLYGLFPVLLSSRHAQILPTALSGAKFCFI